MVVGTTALQAPGAPGEPVDADNKRAKMKVRDERSAWEVFQREPGTGFLMIPDPLFPDKTGWIEIPEGLEQESSRE
jgi:hypothetical protein